jgi:formylglycine-generating enzyme required for sulfatase activity
MTCVQGGVFFLGTDVESVVAEPTWPERLVQVHAFALDTDEMTVRTVRALVGAGRILAPVRYVADPQRPEYACTYVGPTATDHDELPINCIDRDVAAAACAALGKRLPTEAEWEWAAGNGPLETDYPWGSATDVCDRAIVARGRVPEEGADEATTCRAVATPAIPWGPVAGGSALDLTASGLRNLGGNMTEWASDAFAPYDDPCWGAGILLVDPQCTTPVANPAGIVVSRGGEWALFARTARSTTRIMWPATSAGTWSSGVGVRCVKAM